MRAKGAEISHSHLEPLMTVHIRDRCMQKSKMPWTSLEQRISVGDQGTPTENTQIWKSPAPGAPCGGPSKMRKRAACDITKGDVINDTKGQAKTEPAADEEVAKKLPAESLDLDATNDPLAGKIAPTDANKGLIVMDIKTQSTLARASGALKTFTVIEREARSALGIVGTFAGAAFVILDFINHEWVGAAIGTVGLFAGVAAGLAPSGPIGWVIGGIIAALFACELIPCRWCLSIGVRSTDRPCVFKVCRGCSRRGNRGRRRRMSRGFCSASSLVT